MSVQPGELIYTTHEVYSTVRAAENARIISCDIPFQCFLCTRHDISELQEHPVNIPDDGIGYSRRSITANRYLQTFYANLDEILKSGLNCIRFHQIKREELMLLLRAYYTKEELYTVFRDSIEQDSEFKLFVMQHYKEVSCVSELASLANMSVRNFQRKFKSEFSCPARKWLLSRKAENVLHALQTSDKDMMTIAMEHGFSAMSYFTTFCKHNLGRTPSELRHLGHNGINKIRYIR